MIDCRLRIVHHRHEREKMRRHVRRSSREGRGYEEIKAHARCTLSVMDTRHQDRLGICQRLEGVVSGDQPEQLNCRRLGRHSCWLNHTKHW